MPEETPSEKPVLHSRIVQPRTLLRKEDVLKYKHTAPPPDSDSDSDHDHETSGMMALLNRLRQYSSNITVERKRVADLPASTPEIPSPTRKRVIRPPVPSHSLFTLPTRSLVRDPVISDAVEEEESALRKLLRERLIQNSLQRQRPTPAETFLAEALDDDLDTFDEPDQPYPLDFSDNDNEQDEHEQVYPDLDSDEDDEI